MTTTIALVQSSPSDDAEKNLSVAREKIEEAASQGAQIICLPELFKTHYFCKTEDTKIFDLAETIPGPTTKALAPLAKKHKVVIVVPLFEKRGSGVYHNSAAILDADGSLKGTYRKMHIPDDPGFYEKFYFTPGDLGYPVFETRYGKIGVLICWDQWFPEAARMLTLKGAELIFYPTAIGWHPDEKAKYGKTQLEAWQTVQRGHAVANEIYIAVANRVGFEANPSGKGGIEFWGHSFIAGPQGEMLKEAGDKKEEILMDTVDPKHIEEVRRHWPFLRDRRIESYTDITKRLV